LSGTLGRLNRASRTDRRTSRPRCRHCACSASLFALITKVDGGGGVYARTGRPCPPTPRATPVTQRRKTVRRRDVSAATEDGTGPSPFCSRRKPLGLMRGTVGQQQSPSGSTCDAGGGGCARAGASPHLTGSSGDSTYAAASPTRGAGGSAWARTIRRGWRLFRTDGVACVDGTPRPTVSRQSGACHACWTPTIRRARSKGAKLEADGLRAAAMYAGAAAACCGAGTLAATRAATR
jgi:hypothetical protein